jgi:bifunctional DNA-binding transcriptional regulator/antitoxin component of YhaV-PrlF toxin-antitoxin module
MAESPDEPGFAEGQARFEATAEVPQRWTLKVASDGRFVIPAAARSAMELDENGTVTAVLRDGALTLVSPHAVLRQIQAMVKEHREKHGFTGSVVDELISERHEAAARGD